MHSYFFDTNIYRNLTKSQDGKAVLNFNASLDKFEILKQIASQNVLFKMTPFTLIEALGITIPNPSISLPIEQLDKANKKRDVIGFISNAARTFYSSLPQTKRTYLLQKAEEQSRYTSPEAKAIEKIIDRPLLSDTIEEYLISCLLFDYVCKFDYPKDVERDVLHSFLIPSFFVPHALTSGLSKFRIVKKLWDRMYPEIYVKSDYPTPVLEEMSKSMRIKRYEDFLDCELIHLACLGDYYDQKYSPVVSFTCDDSQKVIARIRIYKSVLSVFINLMVEKGNDSYRTIIQSWKEGTVAFCNPDGTLKDVIEINKIPAFI